MTADSQVEAPAAAVAPPSLSLCQFQSQLVLVFHSELAHHCQRRAWTQEGLGVAIACACASASALPARAQTAILIVGSSVDCDASAHCALNAVDKARPDLKLQRTRAGCRQEEWRRGREGELVTALLALLTSTRILAERYVRSAVFCAWHVKFVLWCSFLGVRRSSDLAVKRR